MGPRPPGGGRGAFGQTILVVAPSRRSIHWLRCSLLSLGHSAKVTPVRSEHAACGSDHASDFCGTAILGIEIGYEYNIPMDVAISTTRPISISRQRLLIAGLHAMTLLLGGLHLYVRTLPPTPTTIPDPDSAESAWWGLWPIHYVPWWIVLLGYTVILLSIALGWKSVNYPHTAAASRTPYPISRIPHPISLILYPISLILIITFFIFPTVHTRWGDAYMLSKAISWPDPALRLTHSWQAPLDVFLHSQLWLRLHETYGWRDAMPIYRLLSPSAGALYLLIVLWISRDERFAPNWLTYSLLSTVGVMQLFFGYVENYSFAAVGVLAYLGLGMRVVRCERALWLAATVLAITNATHPSTIILAPSLIFLGWSSLQQGNQSRRSVVLQIGLPMMAIAAGTIVLMEAGGHGIASLLTDDRPGGGDARFFVPLFAVTTRWEHYTMFSWLHLRDFLNEQLLVAPVVLIGMSIAYCVLRVASIRSDIQDTQHATRNSRFITRFLLIATVAYLLFTWMWNPDYGGQRDWDLFSLATLPTTLLFIDMLNRALPTRRYLMAGAVPLIVLQGLHTAAWIYQNTLPWAWPE